MVVDFQGLSCRGHGMRGKWCCFGILVRNKHNYIVCFPSDWMAFQDTTFFTLSIIERKTQVTLEMTSNF